MEARQLCDIQTALLLHGSRLALFLYTRCHKCSIWDFLIRTILMVGMRLHGWSLQQSTALTPSACVGAMLPASMMFETRKWCLTDQKMIICDVDCVLFCLVKVITMSTDSHVHFVYDKQISMMYP